MAEARFRVRIIWLIVIGRGMVLGRHEGLTLSEKALFCKWGSLSYRAIVLPWDTCPI